MSSSRPRPSGGHSKDAFNVPLGSRDSNSGTGKKHKRHAPGSHGSKNSQTQLSATPPDYLKGAETGQRPSMATRLGASASGLMSDALGSSSANGFASGLAATAIDGGKGQSSFSSSGPSESSTALQNFKNRPDAGVGHSHARIQPESFRSSPKSTRGLEKQAQSDFDEFMLNGDGPSAPNAGRNGVYDDKSSGHGQLPGFISYSSTRDEQVPDFGTQSASSASQSEDGAAVVSLLSDPGFSVDDPSAYHDMYDHDSAATDPLISRLSSQERDMLTRIKTQLPQPPLHRAPAPTNPLNLLPNFDQSSSITNGRSGSHASTTSKAKRGCLTITGGSIRVRSSGQTSSRMVSELGKANLSQWLDVLNRYQDEVWGDMAPLVKDARKEIERAINSKSDESHEGPAIRRLAMVFAHLKTSPA